MVVMNKKGEWIPPIELHQLEGDEQSIIPRDNQIDVIYWKDTSQKTHHISLQK
jgi:hypothetical protein